MMRGKLNEIYKDKFLIIKSIIYWWTIKIERKTWKKKMLDPSRQTDARKMRRERGKNFIKRLENFIWVN